MAQVLAPGLVVVEGDMPCFPKHTIRASTSCGFPSGTLNMCVYDRSAGLKRMLARCAKVHFKRMVVRVLRTVARGGAKCTRDASLDRAQERGKTCCMLARKVLGILTTPAHPLHSHRGPMAY